MRLEPSGIFLIFSIPWIKLPLNSTNLPFSGLIDANLNLGIKSYSINSPPSNVSGTSTYTTDTHSGKYERSNYNNLGGIKSNVVSKW